MHGVHRSFCRPAPRPASPTWFEEFRLVAAGDQTPPRKSLPGRSAHSSVWEGIDATTSIGAELATEDIVTTFILVISWRAESRSRLSAREIDAVFLALGVPALTPASGSGGR